MPNPKTFKKFDKLYERVIAESDATTGLYRQAMADLFVIADQLVAETKAEFPSSVKEKEPAPKRKPVRLRLPGQ